MRHLHKLLDYKSPIRAWCRFRKKHEPASDVDTVVVDSLKALTSNGRLESGHDGERMSRGYREDYVAKVESYKATNFREKSEKGSNHRFVHPQSRHRGFL